MDPNNNQPIGTNPIQQPVAPQPIATSPVEPAPAPAQPVAPKKGMGKGIILLIVLILLALGMVGYVLFAKNQLNNTQKSITGNTSTVLPSPTTVPTLTPTPESDLEVASPEADLLDIEADIKGL